MTILLAVETSGSLCSVALHVEGAWTEDTQNVSRLHNQVLFRQIDGVARRAGVRPRHIQVVAFGAGPGSFTGVRIAAATAQAVALANEATVIPVSSSLALAECVRQASAARLYPGVITVTRSRRDAHYLAAYTFAGGACHLERADGLHQGVEAATFEPQLAGWPGAGDRPPWWSDGAGGAPFIEGMATTAVVVGQLALRLYSAGAGGAPEAGLPVYVHGDSPWRPQVESTAGAGAPV
jgi:tRNA threonylcarbamoyladenosine biosynthesis protein TsaB